MTTLHNRSRAREHLQPDPAPSNEPSRAVRRALVVGAALVSIVGAYTLTTTSDEAEHDRLVARSVEMRNAQVASHLAGRADAFEEMGPIVLAAYLAGLQEAQERIDSACGRVQP